MKDFVANIFFNSSYNNEKYANYGLAHVVYLVDDDIY